MTAAFALFEIFHAKAHELVAAQTAANEQGKDGAIAFAFERFGIGRGEQLAGLFARQPVPCPRAFRPRAGHFRDAGSELGG